MSQSRNTRVRSEPEDRRHLPQDDFGGELTVRLLSESFRRAKHDNRRLVEAIGHFTVLKDILLELKVDNGNDNVTKRIDHSLEQLDCLVRSEPKCFAFLPESGRCFVRETIKSNITEIISADGDTQQCVTLAIPPTDDLMETSDSACEYKVLDSVNGVKDTRESSIAPEFDAISPESMAVSAPEEEEIKAPNVPGLVVNDILVVPKDKALKPKKSVKNDLQGRILHIRNLVRPFTIPELKRLLSATGTIDSNRFWIDSLRSHCYVTYLTAEEAKQTVAALNGKKWPNSNPNKLSVQFSSAKVLERVLNPDIKLLEVIPKRPKRELFRKTKTLPSLYWQPLCDVASAVESGQRQGSRKHRVTLNADRPKDMHQFVSKLRHM